MKSVKAFAQSLIHILNPSLSVSNLLFFYGYAFGTDNTDSLNSHIKYTVTISNAMTIIARRQTLYFQPVPIKHLIVIFPPYFSASTSFIGRSLFLTTSGKPFIAVYILVAEVLQPQIVIDIATANSTGLYPTTTLQEEK